MLRWICGKKLPVIDEPAASNVRRMFEMRASGISPNKIAQTFNDEHIPIPSDYKEEKFGIPNTRRSHHLWSCATVKQILNNSTYLGHLVQMRTTTVSYKNKKIIKRDPEDMIIVYNVSIDENKARADFLKQRDNFAKKEETESRIKLRKDKARLEELSKLLSSVYEDKMLGRIPEEVCIELLKKYQDEKTELVTEIAALESKLSEMERTTADVDEFIRRLKAYIDVPELTREMCM